jgi:carboxyl-terminal processing protease
MRRFTVLLLALLLAGAASRVPTRAAFADSAPGLQTVYTAYQGLLTLSYRHPQPDDLLQAGWQAASDTLPAPASLPKLPPLPADANGAFSTFAGVYSSVIQKSGVAKSAAQSEGFALTIADGMAQSLDEQHTAVVPGGAISNVAGSGAWGLGVNTTEDKPPIVTEIAPDSGAQAAGIQPGDALLTVNAKPARYPVDERLLLAALQAGSPPSTMQVTVQRAGKTVQLSVMPSEYSFPLLSSRLLTGNIGYLRLDEFSSKSDYQRNGLQLTTDLDRRLADFETHGAKGLVLDLRDNGGGSVDTAEAILGRFLPEGTLTIREDDGTGQRQTVEMVNGLMRPVQLPMVVLVNGGSASSSETVSQVLKENHRALIVGTTTAGALATARMIPLDDFAMMEVGMASITTATGNYVVDRQGVTPDIQADDTRTADDYRAGRDPQLDAAVKAIAQAPTPPPYQPPATPLVSAQAVHNLLAGYAPQLASITGDDGAPVGLIDGGAYDTANPSELAYYGAPDPRALLAALRSRGWLGRHIQSYYLANSTTLIGTLEVDFDLYSTPDGASAALHNNDTPTLLQAGNPPAQLGDESAAYTGVWELDGGTVLLWRHGAALITLTLGQNPGDAPRNDLLLAAAEQVDAVFLRYPTTSESFQKGLTTLAASAAAPVATTATAGSIASATAPATSNTASSPATVSQAQTQASDIADSARKALNPTLLVGLMLLAALVLTGRYAFRR